MMRNFELNKPGAVAMTTDNLKSGQEVFLIAKGSLKPLTVKRVNKLSVLFADKHGIGYKIRVRRSNGRLDDSYVGDNSFAPHRYLFLTADDDLYEEHREQQHYNRLVTIAHNEMARLKNLRSIKSFHELSGPIEALSELRAYLERSERGE